MFESDDSLRAWIREHRVCYELDPRIEVHGDRHIQVGFDLTLHAEYPAAFAQAKGSDEHIRHYERLKQIALRALPPGIEPSLCRFSAFDSSYHLRAETNWTPELEVTVQIVHADVTFGGVDQAEQGCADAIQAALTAMGARPRVWGGQ